MNNSYAFRSASNAARNNDEATARIADALVAAWQDRIAALVPIIGQRGVAALYGHCLAMTCEDHPWLRGTQEAVSQTAIDLQALRAVLSRQSPADAEAGGRLLAQTFLDSLDRLIGPSLTEHLLRPTPEDASSILSAREISQ